MTFQTAGKSKRFSGPFLGVLAAFLLSGCLVSDHRLAANEQPSADSPLKGFWQAPWPSLLTKDTLNILYVAGRDHYYAVRGRGRYFGRDSNGQPIETQNIRQYRAYPSRLDGRLFFSLVPVREDPPVFVIVEAVLKDSGRTLQILEPKDEVVERAMADGKLLFRIQEDSKVVSSAPDPMAAWLLSLGLNDFKVADTFERWPAPVDELKNSLT